MLSLPFRVAYDRLCPEWDERSCPRIVDASGQTVLTPPQFVGHPGLYDEQADEICKAVVASMEALVIAEWSNDDPEEFDDGDAPSRYCPVCGNEKRQGHDTGCSIGNALRS